MRKLLLTLCALAVSACGSNSLTDATQVKTWANSASAVGVFANVHDPLAYADGQYTFTDLTCPATTDDGTTVVIHGGCTDSHMVQWLGTVTIVRSGGDRMLTADHYGKSGNTLTGTVALHEMSATMHSFDASFHVDGGVTTTYIYSGTVMGTWGTPTVWNGSGTVQRSGIAAPEGTVTATTADERLDSTVCGQPVSGTTTIGGGGDSVVITYDGATDCDAAHAAHWALDGADRGTIEGIDCSATPGRPAPAAPVVASLSLAALALVRRRRSR